ncbi:cupin [candidate division WOR-1 bacterium RIFOXYA12_FULL_43_27]|uniref:Cupin n=1 Tax=candidate division WOR-1 bacterium RIFOXYC2_FULL_46_14 TaxID=1802587 RepID=A0A1F4U6V5_UNCSA|nr:MAG: cupin [candidate division WOR-1 bacterium RIFOXYA12_FULL_43_27]OGC19494.1 MAG: cupin [candidate division WOR-1 bacterium RIFOXYB2_FULL_46_45]OGC30482.1 MAG: cupin [candidate division WOR-1 bacterium RIFOXYA2_FULL_46_56]OGC40550.1 MAG: cupin [candidate division WOR-1 bacterium RIFOXYC2_FULL_46_14]
MENPVKKISDDIVKYQKDSIVSNMLMDKERGSVTLFAIDQDQGISEHTTPFDALVQIIEGEATITISGEKHNLKAGEFIIMPANDPHAVKAVTKFKMLLTMIK